MRGVKLCSSQINIRFIIDNFVQNTFNILNMNKIYTLLLFVLFSNLVHAQKITLTKAMLTNITVKGNENYLIDQQALYDPKANPNLPSDADGALLPPFTIIESNGSQRVDLYIPMIVVIDLKREYTLTDVYYYINNGSVGNFAAFYAGTPTTWETTPFASIEANGYQSWVSKTLTTPKKTRFIKLQVNSVGISIRELMFYGSTIQPIVADPIPTGVQPERPNMWNFAGTNIIGNEFATDIYSVSGTHRAYSDLKYFDTDITNAYPNNTFSFGGGGYDLFMKYWKDNGYHQFWAVQGNSQRFINANSSVANADNIKPIATGADPENPASYIEHGDALFQLAARYGNVAVAQSRLRVNTSTTAASGLGYLNSVENGNENNKFWKGRAGYFSPYEYAAMSSADYDGHENTLGPNIGIKNADPNFKLINAAIIGIDTSYIKAMAHWCYYKRADKKFIWDVINIHHYCNDAGGQTAIPATTGISPEADQLYEKLKSFIDFKNRYWPEKEVWLSEFGYDICLVSDGTSPVSNQIVPTIAGQTKYETQSNLTIRSFLIGNAAGLNKMQQYMLRHSNFSETEAGLYNSSGMVNKGGYDALNKVTIAPEPYPVWYALYTMRNTLKDYSFTEIVNSGNANVWIYKFTNRNNQIAYAVWCPTSNNTVVSNYSFPVGAATTATYVTFQNNSRTGAAANLTASNGSVSIRVSESPSYLVLGTSVSTAVAEPEAKAVLFSFAPNPSKSDITLFLKNDTYLVTIYDVLGATVLSKKVEGESATIDVSALKSGTYLIHVINSAGEVAVKKLIKV